MSFREKCGYSFIGLASRESEQRPDCLTSWEVTGLQTLVGESLKMPQRIDVVGAFVEPDATSCWVLKGVTSHTRYSTAHEKEQLVARQAGLGRVESTCASLIPIRKSQAWWDLAQDHRRALFEEQSRHTSIGMDYLPAIARRLHHSRDLGEPFDFLTWFEFAPQDEPAFDELLRRLRETAEWSYVDREIDIRLQRLPVS